jgi:hypothetical protein
MTTDEVLKDHAEITAVDVAQIDAILSRGPSGAFAVAGVATAIVIALYFAFYVFVYLPRGIVQ